MKRRNFLNTIGGASGLMLASPLMAGKSTETGLSAIEMKPLLPGIWRYTFGKPEKITPQRTRLNEPDENGLKLLPDVSEIPVDPVAVLTQRGVLVRIPLKSDEYIYGLGLQLQSFQQRGLKKMLRVNADPIVDSGDSHAPVPFYVTTAGYGVLIDTARYATFYLGNKKKKPVIPAKAANEKPGNDGWNALNGPYEKLGLGNDSEVMIEIPHAQGIDVYIFAGPSLKQVVQRYNLFSGGGALPPRWGLGFWYRVQSDFKQDEVSTMARYFRESRIPCDVLGLEPHWQTHAYSCTYVWDARFPDPAGMIRDLKNDHFRLNLWEHAFVHPTSPIYKDLVPWSGDYEVWEGLVPDFLTKEARSIYAGFHKKEHTDIGVSGYKADECDNSDFTGNWSYPELSAFPSGADGEQMHCLIGTHYQETILGIFKKKNERTYGLVRSSGALASPYPFVLYSDLYVHKNFIHGVAQSGFSGILWTPEVRHAVSNEDLIRRLQSVVFSPLAMINAWYLKNAPWKQIERRANNEGRFAENWEELEAKCREIIQLRMKIIPVLHSAFVRYHREGIPPFRALVMDYPGDPAVRNISNQYLVGDNMLVAPVVEGEKRRKVYLPEGDWYDFWSSKKYQGKAEYTVGVPLDQIPVFVKSGTILPLAKPTLHTDDPESRKISAIAYGEKPESAFLYEDNGKFDTGLKQVKLSWDADNQKVILESDGVYSEDQYSLVDWKHII
jgi:alpha-D-xyloside xylohydrolase